MMEGLKGSMKGQAVMEYLITYGLALFVILIVLAILVAVVLPQLKAPEACQFSQPGFGCNSKQHVLFTDKRFGNAVNAIIQLDNQQGRDVTVSYILCTDQAPGNLNSGVVGSNPGVTEVSSEEGSMVAGSNKQFTLGCVDSDGNAVSMSPGSSFKGSIAVIYSYQNEVTGAPSRLAIATITGTVQGS
jgi:hypothetical protein